MAPNTTYHSDQDHGNYSHRPDTDAQFPAVPLESLISFISLFEFYAHALFSSGNWFSIMPTLFLGVGL